MQEFVLRKSDQNFRLTLQSIPQNGIQKTMCHRSKELMNRINTQLDQVRYKITECYYKLKTQNTYITAEAIKRLYTGEDKTTNTLLSVFEYHFLNSKETLKYGTLKNYSSTEKYIRRFLKEKYRTNDIELCELKYQFITKFDLFLRTTEPPGHSNPLSNNGIMKHMERLRKVVTLAVKMDRIEKDPFLLYKS